MYLADCNAINDAEKNINRMVSNRKYGFSLQKDRRVKLQRFNEF